MICWTLVWAGISSQSLEGAVVELVAETEARRSFQEEVETLVTSGQFAELDALLGSLRSKDATWPSGDLKIADFYRALDSLLYGYDRQARRRDLATVESYVHLLRQWVALRPDSFPAHVALAKAYGACLAPAITLQFGKYDSWKYDCVPNGLQLAAQTLAAAAGLPTANDPERYVMEMDIATGQQSGMAEVENCFRKAIAISPTYVRAYERMAVTHFNRGGVAAACNFATKVADELGGGTGDAIYAQIFRSLTASNRGGGPLQLDRELFSRTGFQWERVQRGFRHLREAAPDSLRVANDFCRLACVAVDRPVARELFQLLDGRRDDAVWISEDKFLAWERWATNPYGYFNALPRGECIQGGVRALDFSADGKTLGIGYSDGWVTIWNIAPLQLRASLQIGTAPIGVMRFSPDGQLLATAICEACSDKPHGQVFVWDMASGYELAKTAENLPPITAVEFLADGHSLIVGSGKREALEASLRIWDFQKNQEHPISLGTTNPVNALAVSPSDEFAAIAELRRLSLWDLKGNQPTDFMSESNAHMEHIRAVAFSPDGQRVATGSSPGWPERNQFLGEIMIWTLGKFDVTQWQLPRTHGGILALDFSPDGQLLAAAGFDGVVTIWDHAGGVPLARFIWNMEPIRALAFSPDGRILAAGGDFGLVILFDVETAITPKTWYRPRQ